MSREEAAREPREGPGTRRGGRFSQGDMGASGADRAQEDAAVCPGGWSGRRLSAGRVDLLTGPGHLLRLVSSYG